MGTDALVLGIFRRSSVVKIYSEISLALKESLSPPVCLGILQNSHGGSHLRLPRDRLLPQPQRRPRAVVMSHLWIYFFTLETKLGTFFILFFPKCVNVRSVFQGAGDGTHFQKL